MPQDVSPAVYKLQQPEKLSEVLADDRANYDDCMPCRLLGAGAFMGLGIYTYFSGHYQIKEREKLILKSGSRLGIKTRQGMITAMAAGLVGLGVYRLNN